MTLLVTGGAGFIGSNFIARVLSDPRSAGENIICVDNLGYAGNLRNLESAFSSNRFRFLKGSIGDRDFIDGILKSYMPSRIVNFAAESHVDRSINSPSAFIDTNIVGVYCLLDAFRRYRDLATAHFESEGREIRFLHVSTDEVYGTLDPDDPPFKEISAYRPNSPYAASKAAADHLVRAWVKTYGLPCIVTNCSNNYGPYQFPEKLIPLIISNALECLPLPIYGDGKQVREWIYVDDHCDALLTVMKFGNIGEVYNIGSGNEATNLDIVAEICNILDRLMPLSDGTSYSSLVRFVADRPGHDRRYAIDSSKIKAELGWFPRFDLSTGLLRTVKWYVDNGAWLREVRTGEYRRWMESHYGFPIEE